MFCLWPRELCRWPLVRGPAVPLVWRPVRGGHVCDLHLDDSGQPALSLRWPSGAGESRAPNATDLRVLLLLLAVAAEGYGREKHGRALRAGRRAGNAWSDTFDEKRTAMRRAYAIEARKQRGVDAAGPVTLRWRSLTAIVEMAGLSATTPSNYGATRAALELWSKVTVRVAQWHGQDGPVILPPPLSAVQMERGVTMDVAPEWLRQGFTLKVRLPLPLRSEPALALYLYLRSRQRVTKPTAAFVESPEKLCERIGLRCRRRDALVRVRALLAQVNKLIAEDHRVRVHGENGTLRFAWNPYEIKAKRRPLRRLKG